jgi:hypothetical protein
MIVNTVDSGGHIHPNQYYGESCHPSATQNPNHGGTCQPLATLCPEYGGPLRSLVIDSLANSEQRFSTLPIIQKQDGFWD